MPSALRTMMTCPKRRPVPIGTSLTPHRSVPGGGTKLNALAQLFSSRPARVRRGHRVEHAEAARGPAQHAARFFRRADLVTIEPRACAIALHRALEPDLTGVACGGERCPH